MNKYNVYESLKEDDDYMIVQYLKDYSYCIVSGMTRHDDYGEYLDVMRIFYERNLHIKHKVNQEVSEWLDSK